MTERRRPRAAHAVPTAVVAIVALVVSTMAQGAAHAEAPDTDESLASVEEDEATTAPGDAGAEGDDPRRYGPFRLRSGIVLPYPLDNVFRGFADCRRGRHRHPALDIGGVGPNWGLGTPIRAMARSRVTSIGSPEADPARWGTRLTDAETAIRGRSVLPTSGEHPGYGKVWYFTRDYGRSRTGVVISTIGLEGRLKGHTITYMHLAAIHPSLAVGSVVEAGQELGLMGGTAVLEAAPHLHVAVKNRAGRNLDLGPLLGIGPTRASCRRGKAGERALRKRYSAKAREVMTILRKRVAAVPTVGRAPLCGEWTFEERVDGRGLAGHRVELPPTPSVDPEAPWTLTVTRLSGRWQPRLILEDPWGNARWSGAPPPRRARGQLGVADSRTGRRGDTAAITLRPSPERVASAVIGAWGRSDSLPADATYRFTLSRPCGAGSAHD